MTLSMNKTARKFLFIVAASLMHANALFAIHLKIVKGSRLECSSASGRGVVAKAMFGPITGKVDFDLSDLKNGKFEFGAKTKNLEATDKRQEEDLKSAHCFNADRYPDLTFKSDSVVCDRPGGIVYHVYGMLEAGGVGKPAKIQLTAIPVKDGYTFRGTMEMKLSAYAMRTEYTTAENLTFFLELRTEPAK